MRKASGHVPLRMCYGGGSSGLVLNRISERLLGFSCWLHAIPTIREGVCGERARGCRARLSQRGCAPRWSIIGLDETNYYEDEW